jgi:probable F420-dependent oxidoreductase
VRIGLALPQFDYSVPGESPLRWETVAAYAARAEELGFESLWLADHLFLSIERYGGPPGEHACYDPLVALGALAVRTSRARLGVCVVCTQLRPPTVLAKAVATLDVLSGGRLVVGMGAGWYEPEYHAAGVPFGPPRTRLAQLGEAADIVRAMVGGGPLDYAGAHYRAAGAPCLPPSPRPGGPPIWIGGRGDRLLEVAARHGDGWNTVWVWTPEAYQERLAALARACERAGRDPATVTRSLGLYALVGEDEADLRRRWERLVRRSPPGTASSHTLADWRTGRLVGTVEQVREQLAVWEDLGVDTLILGAGAVPFAIASPDDVELLAAACRL